MGNRTVKRLSAVSVKKIYTLKMVPLSVAEYVRSSTSCEEERSVMHERCVGADLTCNFFKASPAGGGGGGSQQRPPGRPSKTVPR